MARSALAFFPQNPFPAKTGAHRRFLEVLGTLTDLGYKTTLAGATHYTSHPWKQESVTALKRAYSLSDVAIYRPNVWDQLRVFWFRGMCRAGLRQPGIGSPMYVHTQMKVWFSDLVRQVLPELVFINYAGWADLLDGIPGSDPYTMIDAHDLVSMNVKLSAFLHAHLPGLPIHPKDVADRLLTEGIQREVRFEPEQAEFDAYDRFRVTFAITEREKEIIQTRTRKTRVVWLPVTVQPEVLENTYSGNAVLPMGPNIFNAHGYAFLIRKIVSCVRKELTSFNVDVCGVGCRWIRPAEGARILGFVEDLTDVYRHARFLAAPNLFGTGQQVRIVEALAHGVPVVAMAPSAVGSPVIHGTNGFIAETAAEFANYSVRLMTDRELCARLGQAGRETIREVAARKRMIETLRAVLPG